jgi:predicted enzyme related to lactoylglutathione lyase
MHANALAGIILYSPDPERLAAFYRETIGIPFEPHTHGGAVKPHNEALWQNVHFAIWGASEPHAPQSASGGKLRNALVPSFVVDDVDGYADQLRARGVPMMGKLIELGEGKRLGTFLDPDGNQFRLIQLRPTA